MTAALRAAASPQAHSPRLTQCSFLAERRVQPVVDEHVQRLALARHQPHHPRLRAGDREQATQEAAAQLLRVDGALSSAVMS